MGRKKYQGRRAGAFIFDLDGTLIDSGLDIAQAANFARGHFDLPELPIETVIAYVGDGVPTLLTRCLEHDGPAPSEEKLAEAIEVFRDHYARHCLDNTVPHTGVLATLVRFQRIPMMVATNKPRRFTMQILEELHLSAAFERVVAGDEVPRRKPDPAMLQKCLDGVHVPPGEVIVVGDHANDVLCARAIGATAVGVTYGLTTPGQIRAAKPDLLIDAFPELIELFPSRQTH